MGGRVGLNQKNMIYKVIKTINGAAVYIDKANMAETVESYLNGQKGIQVTEIRLIRSTDTALLVLHSDVDIENINHIMNLKAWN